jgi:hypothetical protein
MFEGILVEYWHSGAWTWGRDYPATKRGEVDALEYGRSLWRSGAAGVRITKFARQVLVEHKR